MKCAPRQLHNKKKNRKKERRNRGKPAGVIKEESVKNKRRERNRVVGGLVGGSWWNAQISIFPTALRWRRFLVRIMAAQNRSNLAPKRRAAKQNDRRDKPKKYDRIGYYL